MILEARPLPIEIGTNPGMVAAAAMAGPTTVSVTFARRAEAQPSPFDATVWRLRSLACTVPKAAAYGRSSKPTSILV